MRANGLDNRESQSQGWMLSPVKCAALIACIQGNGALYKRYGAWSPLPTGTSEKRISGNTVADLVRDGLLTLTVIGKDITAHLTPCGDQCARCALAATMR
jgi:hypothetical protein